MVSKKNLKPPPGSGSYLDWKVVRSACIGVLKEFLQQKVGFEEDQRVRRKLRYVAQAPGVQYAEARDTYPIFPFANRNQEQYWLALAIDCERRAIDVAVDAITILVFSGESQKRPVFRAEWDCQDSAFLGSRHAQPHWHVYTQETNEGDEIIYETAPIHFALSARWQTDGLGSHQQRLSNEAEVKDWINGCLEYVRAELSS